MTKRIGIFGGSFNPAGTHHREIARAVARRFDELIVVPCGPRPDKGAVEEIDPTHRAAIVDLTFRGLDRVRVDLSDLEQESFTRTIDLIERHSGEGEVWLVVGSDLVDGRDGALDVRGTWYQGERLWREARFAIVTRRGVPIDASRLPPRHELFELDLEGSSSRIRERALAREDLGGLVVPEVSRYIARWRLYQTGLARRASVLRLEDARPIIVLDEQREEARALAARVPRARTVDEANLVIVIGGDGTLLSAIREHWRLRLPFLGWNTGNRGFLLNEAPTGDVCEWLSGPLVTHHLPLLHVETRRVDGVLEVFRAFNDAWVERSGGQAAWIEVRVDGRPRIERLVADGALVATAPGSTAYARAMGATPLLVDSTALLLVGSNALEPPNWKSAHISLESEVEFLNLDPEKRPLRAFVDGLLEGEVVSMRARLSRAAAVELVFRYGHDMTERLTQVQFPSSPEARIRDAEGAS